MTYVVTGKCENDDVCNGACPDEAMGHGTVEVDGVTFNQYFIDPDKCTECGLCECVCPSNSVHIDTDLTPKEQQYVQVNKAFFAK